MKKFFLYLLISLAFLSCNKDEPWENVKLNLCDDPCFYYSGGSKNYIKYSLTEIKVEFKDSLITNKTIDSILDGYNFNNVYFRWGNNGNEIKIFIQDNCSCEQFKNYLAELNTDDEIYSATPVFYRSENDPESYWILKNEVLTKYDKEVISEPDFIAYAESLNLELSGKRDYSLQFKVKEVTTGFEALNIANQIYESGYVEFSHPNFIAKIELH